MTDFKSSVNPLEQTKHFEGVYGLPPLPRCPCVICCVHRERQAYCRVCKNLGSTNSPCYGCGRGCYWQDWGVITDDAALGA